MNWFKVYGASVMAMALFSFSFNYSIEIIILRMKFSFIIKSALDLSKIILHL